MATAAKKAPHGLKDIGYCFEKIILVATDLGLGTCWLGGTFKRASFANKIGIADDEICPVISPVGYSHSKKTLKDRVLKLAVSSHKRKPWNELFFEGNLSTPLTKGNSGAYDTALECLRKGPSASNNQPWRIVKEPGNNNFHFFLKRSGSYHRFVSVDLQSIDMGIAMCHFELAARELGLIGSWVEEKPHINTEKAEYKNDC